MGCRPELHSCRCAHSSPPCSGWEAQVARPQRAVEAGTGKEPGTRRKQRRGGCYPCLSGGGARLKGGEQRAMNTNDVTSQLSILPGPASD